MHYYYFELDVLKRKVIIYDSDFDFFHDDFILSESKAAHFSFDKIINLIDDYSHKTYKLEIKDIYKFMLQNIIEGKKINSEIEKQYLSLRLKCMNNIFAQIFIDILFNEYEYNRDGLVHLGIVKSLKNAATKEYFEGSKEQIKSIYDNLNISMNDLMYVSENGFINTINNHKFISQCFHINIDDRKMVTLYSLNESFEVFKNVFCGNIEIAGLKVNICNHCHKRFFEKRLSDYCNSKECQKAKDKAANRLKKAKWKEDPYNKVKNKFNGYVDKQANVLKENGIAEEEIEEFKTFGKKIKIDVKMEVDTYGDTSMPLPSEIEKYINEQKNIVMQKRNEILLRHGIIMTRGRPRKK